MTNKLALVTGGSRGIGAVVVAQLRAAGWDAWVPCRHELDFTDPPTIQYTERRFIKDGVPGFDALVFCHGEWYSKPLADKQIEHWYRQYTMRVVWLFEFMEFLLHGQKPIESVTVVASTQAFGGRAETIPYAAACAAQVRAIQGYATSFDKSRGTRFNAVCPGLTDTAMAAQVQATGDCRPDAVPQPPEAVAGAVLGLVTDGVSNGRVVRVVDGEARDAKWSW